MDDKTRTELEAAAFRHLLDHLRELTDVQNIDLMNLAGFCRNCLSKWYRAAADQGDDQAQANLAQLYFDGRGVPLDLVQAYKWFRLSDAQGNFRAAKGLEDYRKHDLLTPEQLANAEKLYRDFRPQPANVQL